jgi:archaetidylinositol phosphate synthase
MPSALNPCGVAAAPFNSATRIQSSFAAETEKRILIWLANRTPHWINSDHLTLLGFISQCGVGLCYTFSRLNPDMLIAGVGCLALNWLGDSLDGTLARVRERQRPRYGFYVDHIGDTIAACFLMSGLAISQYIHPVISLGMLAAFLALSIETYLATYTLGRFQLSYWKLGPTEIRILLAAGNIALFLKHSTIRFLHHQILLFDMGGIAAIVGMSAMMLISAIRHTKQLYAEEKIQ